MYQGRKCKAEEVVAELQSAVDKGALAVLQELLFHKNSCFSQVPLAPWCTSPALSDILTGGTKIFLQQEQVPS